MASSSGLTEHGAGVVAFKRQSEYAEVRKKAQLESGVKVGWVEKRLPGNVCMLALFDFAVAV